MQIWWHNAIKGKKASWWTPFYVYVGWTCVCGFLSLYPMRTWFSKKKIIIIIQCGPRLSVCFGFEKAISADGPKIESWWADARRLDLRLGPKLKWSTNWLIIFLAIGQWGQHKKMNMSTHEWMVLVLPVCVARARHVLTFLVRELI